jgi:hypothetical protein
MKCFMTTIAILLVLVAFNPAQTLAKGPGNSGNSSNSGSSGSSSNSMQSSSHINMGNSGSNSGSNYGFNFNKGMNNGSSKGMNQGMSQGMNPNKFYSSNNKPEFSGDKGKDNWRYRWDNGRWWFWGPGDQWMWYGDDGRWLNYNNAYVVNRPILENFSGDPIKIVNPAKNGVTLNYTLNGALFNIPPGYSQDLREDRAWVIQFNRGQSLDQARYGLNSGVYTFGRTDHGWELYRSDLPQAIGPPAPIAPTNPSTAPTNPPAAAPANSQ